MFEIKLLTPENEKAFYNFTSQYLPDSDHEKMKEYYRSYPDAFLLCEKEGELIGVAFGRDRSMQFPDDDSFELCGIAIRYDHQHNGYGRELLSIFEKSAKKYGAKMISLGSAEGYAEKFYLSCGYVPVEYKVWENDAPFLKKTFSDMADYIAYARPGNGFVVMRKEL